MIGDKIGIAASKAASKAVLKQIPARKQILSPESAFNYYNRTVENFHSQGCRFDGNLYSGFNDYYQLSLVLFREIKDIKVFPTNNENDLRDFNWENNDDFVFSKIRHRENQFKFNLNRFNYYWLKSLFGIAQVNQKFSLRIIFKTPMNGSVKLFQDDFNHIDIQITDSAGKPRKIKDNNGSPVEDGIRSIRFIYFPNLLYHSIALSEKKIYQNNSTTSELGSKTEDFLEQYTIQYYDKYHKSEDPSYELTKIINAFKSEITTAESDKESFELFIIGLLIEVGIAIFFFEAILVGAVLIKLSGKLLRDVVKGAVKTSLKRIGKEVVDDKSKATILLEEFSTYFHRVSEEVYVQTKVITDKLLTFVESGTANKPWTYEGLYKMATKTGIGVYNIVKDPYSDLKYREEFIKSLCNATMKVYSANPLVINNSGWPFSEFQYFDLPLRTGLTSRQVYKDFFKNTISFQKHDVKMTSLYLEDTSKFIENDAWIYGAEVPKIYYKNKKGYIPIWDIDYTIAPYIVNQSFLRQHVFQNLKDLEKVTFYKEWEIKKKNRD
tara:strand:+ start:6338 stop:7990 length:1653 start_codon:yes stop_codon:yes gene_type:complete